MMRRSMPEVTQMIHDPLFILVAIACAVVVVILMVGVGGFARGGSFNAKYANKIMRLRLLAQFIAVILIVLFVWVSKH
ncbi:preprotein translocase subunit SecG [Amaricoccus macauensis]|uniref:Preprotein translocase subunit SecG n=2 Tax=Amaricoccus macauensis TaxID=57001 RepID=A0A840SSA5_9RHOB|nr:preprotein translocase subunit SecG [Amaricoccus macauensis]